LRDSPKVSELRPDRSLENQMKRERMTKGEQEVLLKLRSLRTDPNPPQKWISLSLEKFGPVAMSGPK
jgi:hypothetical protein